MAGGIGERLNNIGAKYAIDEDLVFGLDIGIASVGSAVVRFRKNANIEFAGSRCFEVPEVAKNKELKNKKRRDSRLSRRVIRRRARRMSDVRAILHEAGLIGSTDPEDMHNRTAQCQKSPWALRADALDKKLTDEELARVLIHIAKHRGFKSMKKSEVGANNTDDTGKMLGAISENKELLAKYGSVGKLVMNDPKFADHKRNKGGEYTHTHARDDLLDETKKIIRTQLSFGNSKATEELSDKIVSTAFFQRPLQDSEQLVGMCPFETDQRRSPRSAPSFEKFRFLSKLNTIKIRTSEGKLRRLTEDELRSAASSFGETTKSITWNALAKKIGLSGGGLAFDGIDEKTAAKDAVSAKGCAQGTKTIFDAIGPTGWSTLKDKAEILDQIASVISFREDVSSIEKGLLSIVGLDSIFKEALLDGVHSGLFKEFSGAGHISAKAARNILPGLLKGRVYSDACAEAGYDHSQGRKVSFDDIKNPVVQRSLREAVKQFETLVHTFKARPGRIIVELARDVGKSARERDEITKGIKNRTAEKKQHCEELRELVGLDRDPNEEELQRYELWKEQNYRCIYTDEEISPNDILSESSQVDHVLPRSRSQDNSYANKVLCLTSANQNKGQRTPWEWQGLNNKWWNAYEARVNSLSVKRYKKNLLRMRNFDERARGFVERSLNDTKYASRVLLSLLQEVYEEVEAPDAANPENLSNMKRRIFARPGAVTAILRRAWGLGGLKDRGDDRHHALDALICAAAPSEWLLNQLTRRYQDIEKENWGRWTPSVPPPWDGFREDAKAAYENVFVSRSEKRRGRGAGHNDTFYRLGSVDGVKTSFERKNVHDLTKKDLSRLKDADTGNKPVAIELWRWFDDGKPKDKPPKSPNGDIIKKVYLERSGLSGFELNGGHVDNSGQVRVDVFSLPNKRNKDEFYLVPIYRHRVMNKKAWPKPPNLAIVGAKRESDWVRVDDTFEFRFSLYTDSFIEIVKSNGEIISGYYSTTDRHTGAITLSSHNSRGNLIRGIGVKTLSYFKKFEVNRLGQCYEISGEARTWHGEVCT